MKYKVIDLFAGVGGMSLGFEMAGFDVVLANEYDKDIATAYKKNHSSTKMINEDITKLDLQSVFGCNYRRSAMSSIFYCRKSSRRAWNEK